MEPKQRKDYLPLYTGREVYIDKSILKEDGNAGLYGTGKLVGVNNDEYSGETPYAIVRIAGQLLHIKLKYVKPILRSLLELTLEEALAIVKLQCLNGEAIRIRWKDGSGIAWRYQIKEVRYESCETNFMQISAEQTLYLLKQGFDIFSLIPDGLALGTIFFNEQSFDKKK